MATITQLPSGKWRVQVRRKQSYASATFRRHEDARKWATATERHIDLGETPSKPTKADPSKFAHLIDLILPPIYRHPAKRFTIAIRGENDDQETGGRQDDAATV